MWAGAMLDMGFPIDAYGGNAGNLEKRIKWSMCRRHAGIVF